MLSAVLGVAVGLGVVWVLVVGLGAVRTKKLAMVGLVPTGCAIGAFAWSLFAPQIELALRVGAAFGAIGVGLAHGVFFSLVALPKRIAWVRMVLVPLGMWAGTFLSLWFATSYDSWSLRVPVLVLASGTLTSWVLLPFYSRNLGFVRLGKRQLPSVRFPCPRCGTRVDWTQGVAACTDCGFFLHVLWPADEVQARQAAEGRPKLASPRRSVRFACPRCTHVNEWFCGDGACESCALKLSIHWNVHTHNKPKVVKVLEKRR